MAAILAGIEWAPSGWHLGLRDIGNRQGALRKMFVAADYRGATMGVARLLLQTLIDWGQAKGFTDIYLGTTEFFHAAHRFYEKTTSRRLSAYICRQLFQ